MTADSVSRSSNPPAWPKPSSRPPFEAPPANWDDESDSSVIRVGELMVAGLLAAPDVPPLRDAIAGVGLLLRAEIAAERIDVLPTAPAFAIVDMALPGADAILRRLASEPLRSLAIALTTDGASDARALALGARATLHRPPDPAAVSSVLARLLEEHRETRRRRDLFARAEGNAATEATTRFAAAVTHEIRNALTIAQGNVALLLESDEADFDIAERRTLLRDAEQGLTTVAQVLEALRGLASGNPPSLSSVDLSDAAREATAIAARDARHVEVIANASVLARANRTMLVRVVANLVENAIHATRERPSPRIVVRVYETSQEARISVRDNGPGIPESLREEIFAPLFTTRRGAGGTGLGLAIARGAMVAMGGALTLSRQPPPGACFRVRLRRGSR